MFELGMLCTSYLYSTAVGRTFHKSIRSNIIIIFLNSDNFITDCKLILLISCLFKIIT